MKARYSLIFFLSFLASGVQAQSTIDQVLAQIEANNLAIQAEKRRLEAGAAFLKTGLTLPDPEASVDWLKGFPATAGNQVDILAAQAFDFPTAYSHRREVAALKTGQLSHEAESLRKSVLLEAKLACLDLVWLNKRQAELSRRLAAAEQFYDNYRLKLEAQDATILDVNKARLLALNLQTDLQLVEAERTALLRQLEALNGGIPLAVGDTLYPPADPGMDFESLWQATEAADPEIRYLKAQQQVGQAEMRLERSLLLPRFEGGYRYQGILGQQFHGIHLGVSVPVWENKKKLQYQAVQQDLHEARLQQRTAERYAGIRQRYDRWQALKGSLEEYQEVLEQASGARLLAAALSAGQITALEYYLELSLYYESFDRYLELEAGMQRAFAEMMEKDL